MTKRGKGTPLDSRRRVNVVVDIEKYSRRTHLEQIDLQDRLDWMMTRSFKAAGLDPRRCYRQNQGDGLLFVLPQDIREGVVVPGCVTGVQTALYEVNLLPGPGGRIRMRMAVAEGIVTEGPTGVVGEGVELVCALVGSEAARSALAAHPECDLVVATDDHYYDDVFSQGFDGVRAADFSRATVPTKSSEGSTAGAWTGVLPPARANERVPAFTEDSLAAPRIRYLTDPRVLMGGGAAVGLAGWAVQARKGPGGKAGGGVLGTGRRDRSAAGARGVPTVPGHDLTDVADLADVARPDRDEDGTDAEAGSGTETAETGWEQEDDGASGPTGWEADDDGAYGAAGWEADDHASKTAFADAHGFDADLGGGDPDGGHTAY